MKLNAAWQPYRAADAPSRQAISSTAELCLIPGGIVPLKKARVVRDGPYIVRRVPAATAFNELLERITDHGMELEGSSKLTAMEPHDNALLHAQAKIIEFPSGVEGASGRRRGAPLPRRGR